MLYENRGVGGWQYHDAQVGSTGYGPWYGRARYTQTGAIDAPVVLWLNNSEPRVLHRNWRGNVAGATLVAGDTADTETVWPAAYGDIWLAPDAMQQAPEPNRWLGSLVTSSKDVTGTLYRRNRYYDPVSGRFTQEDPIGLAGGMDLYGYAGGDPINFHDPFGLCPKSMRDDADACFQWNQRQVQRALDIIRDERARQNTHALEVDPGAVFGGNADIVAAECSRLGQRTFTGCVGSSGADIYVNADRDPAAIAWTIVHEQQHILGRGSAAGTERCAVRRAAMFFNGMSVINRNAAAGSAWPAHGTISGSTKRCGF